MTAVSRLLLILLTLNLAPQPAVAQSSTGSFNLGLTISPELVTPGGTAQVDVVMTSNLGQARERLYVYLPDGLQFIGKPSCSGACTQAAVNPMDASQVDAIYSLSGYDGARDGFARLTAMVSVSSDVQPGTVLVVRAYFGSPAVEERAEVKVDSPPTPVPASLHLGLAPDAILVEQESTFDVYLYFGTPSLQGLPQDFADHLPVVVTALVPEGLTLAGDSICVTLVDLKPAPVGSCRVDTSTDNRGRTTVSVDVPPRTQNPIGLVFRFRNEGLKAMSPQSIAFTLSEPSGEVEVVDGVRGFGVYPVDSLAAIDGVDSGGHLSILLDSGSSACTVVTQAGSELGLAEWGGSPVIASSDVLNMPDPVAVARFDLQCPRIVSFPNVGPDSMYVLGVAPGPGTDFLCRACVLGVVPWSGDSIPIVMDGDPRL